MNIRDIKYLVALADYEHFGKAAKASFVSQPALSMQILKLEKTLGIKLLERTNKTVRLTDTGILIVERVRQILNQLKEIQELAKSAQDPYCGDLKIGIFPTLAPYLLPLIIPKLAKIYPKINFYLIEEPSALLIEKLKQGKLNAAFLASPIKETIFKEVSLFEEEFFLAVSKKHPFGKRKQVSPEDLNNKELLLLDEGHCLREQALSLCHRLNALETQGFRATSLETLRQMVAAGVGITLIPKLACGIKDNISYLPFVKNKPVRHISLYWRASSAKQIVLTEISIQIKKILAQQKIVKVIP